VRTRQTTRMLLVQCVPCDYKLRGSQSTLARGIPKCPVCGEAMTYAVPPDVKESPSAA